MKYHIHIITHYTVKEEALKHRIYSLLISKQLHSVDPSVDV